MKKVFQFLGGRAMTFAFLALALGGALAFCGKLTYEFAAFITAVGGLVVVRSVAQDGKNNQTKQPPEGMGR